MKIVSSLSDAALVQPCVASIGNFDGLHLGHRTILETVVRQAREQGLQSAAMTFEPHPIQLLAPDKAPKRISTLSQKIDLIRQTGIDVLFVANFDLEFAQLSPEEFIREYLIDGLHARSVCVGSNFNFGYRGAGNIETLKRWGEHFKVIEAPSVSMRGVRVSSTEIRRKIGDGAVSRACRLLGRWIELEGEIVSGAGRGRHETAPTLNMSPENELVPQRGVYVSRISLDGSAFLDSVTNIGVRPTFGENDLTVETFVISGSVPAAVTHARLQFLRRLRDERRFDSSAALRTQIGRDVARAQKFFRLLGAGGHVRSR